MDLSITKRKNLIAILSLTAVLASVSWVKWNKSLVPFEDLKIIMSFQFHESSDDWSSDAPSCLGSHGDASRSHAQPRLSW